MNQNETQWDKLLKIKTTGRDDSRADQYRYPYEPTPYMVLERLANSGLIRKNNTLLDYGTGKGRVCFYLSYQTRCKAIGVEYDERIYKGAADNKELAVSGARTEFVLCSAENYEVPTDVDCCYFFNPFSVEILQSVLAKIYESYYENPREILLFFYYPSEEYVSALMTQEQLIFMMKSTLQIYFRVRMLEKNFDFSGSLRRILLVLTIPNTENQSRSCSFTERNLSN